jgi:hypothetical protein
MTTQKSDKPTVVTGHVAMMPANVRAGQVVGLVEITGGLGPLMDTAKLAEELGSDLTVLLPALDAGEMLGLVKRMNDQVTLTDFGLKFQKAAKKKIRLLKDQLSKIEPFNTALQLLTKKNAVTAAQIAEALSKSRIRWNHDDELNESLIRTILINWAIFAGLLSYDGRTNEFRKFQ